MSGLSGWNLLPQVPGALDRSISKVVRKAAFDIQRIAMQNAPVDLGALKGSIYVVTHKSSTYDAAVNAAESANPQVELLPEVERPANDRTAFVAVGVTYGIYQEFGTTKMPAHPYLTPAAELVRPQYLDAMRSLEGLLLSALGGGGSVEVNVSDEEPF